MDFPYLDDHNLVSFHKDNWCGYIFFLYEIYISVFLISMFSEYIDF